MIRKQIIEEQFARDVRSVKYQADLREEVLEKRNSEQYKEWDKKYPNMGKKVVNFYDKNGNLIGQAIEE